MQNYSPFSDHELTILLREGSEPAFTEIYNRYWQPMFFIAAKKCANLHDAEGIVQDIFLNIWQRRENLQITGTLRSYLSAAVTYKVIDLLAKRSKSKQWPLAIPDPADYSTEQMLDFAELKSRLEKLVRNLPEKCRVVYELKREDGLTQKEIAGKLNISEKTVEAHLTRALKIIRKGLIHNLLLLLAIFYLLYKFF